MEERGRSAAKGLIMFLGWFLIFVYFNFFTEDDAEASDGGFSDAVSVFGHVLGTFAIVLAIVYFLILYNDQREWEQRRGQQPQDLQRFGELRNQQRQGQHVARATGESQPLLAHVSDLHILPSEQAEERRQLVKSHLLSRRLEHAESVSNLSAMLEATNSQEEERNGGNLIARILQRVETSVQHLIGLPPECAICLDHYEAGETVCWAKVRACNHIYHEDCIVRWLEFHDECPLCRENLLVDDPDEQGCNIC
jgi:hypothetical protein